MEQVRTCTAIVPLGPHVRTRVRASGGDAMHTGCVSPHTPTCSTAFAAYCTQNTPTPATLFYSLWNVARPVLNQPRMSHGAPMSHAFAWCIVSDILFCGQGYTWAHILCLIVCYVPTIDKLCSILFHGTSAHPYRYRTARTARPRNISTRQCRTGAFLGSDPPGFSRKSADPLPRRSMRRFSIR